MLSQVQQLGKNTPEVDSSALIKSLEKVSWTNNSRNAMLRIIRQEKVVLQAYRNAYLINSEQRLKVLEDIVGDLREEYEERRHFVEAIVPKVRVEIAACLNQAQVNFMFIKGSSLDPYPNDHIRQLGDLDIIVENWDDLFRVAQAIEAQGYAQDSSEAEAAWILRIASDGDLDRQLVTHINLVRSENKQSIVLDIHSAPFVVGPSGFLVSDMWARAYRQGAVVPTPEDKLLILVAHAVNHGYFLIKDYNDAYATLHQQINVFDWEYFNHYIKRSSLGHAAYLLVRRIREEYSAQCVPEQVLTNLHRSRSLTCSISMSATTRAISKGPWAERMVFPSQTIAFERGRKGLAAGFTIAARYLWWSIRLAVLQNGLLGSMGDLTLVQRLLHKAGNVIFPVPVSGQQIVLLPVQDILDDFDAENFVSHAVERWETLSHVLKQPDIGLEAKPVGHTTYFLCLDQAEAILTPVGLFVPTEDAIFMDRELEALQKLINRLSDVCRSIY